MIKNALQADGFVLPMLQILNLLLEVINWDGRLGELDGPFVYEGLLF